MKQRELRLNEGMEKTSALVFLGARSANVQPWPADESILIEVSHDTPCPPLRRVPEVPHSISVWFESIP